MPVNALSARVGLSQPLISWHLRILRLAGLIDTQRNGRTTICRLRTAAFEELHEAEARLISGTCRHRAAPSPARGRRCPMSASQPGTRDLRRGDSLLSTRVKETGRAVLAPVVRLAVRLHLTANTVTVIGFLIVVAASGLVAPGSCWPAPRS